MIKKLLPLLALAVTQAVAQPSVSVTQASYCWGAINNVTVHATSTASSYVWSSSGPSCTDSILSAFSNMAVFNFKCCGVHTITCSGYAGSTLLWTVSNTATLGCLPLVTASGGTTGCAGGTVTLSGGGAQTYTWYPGNFTGAVIVAPMGNWCYTVVGANNTGCSSSAVTCLTVAPASTLVASAATVCAGSSVTFTALGLNTYAWGHNSATTGTNSAIPSPGPNWYSVGGTGLYSCYDQDSVYVLGDTTCAIVWPGDANSDGVVNSNDVLELGLYANATGASRSPGGNSYTGQFANAWAGSGSNSQNIAHVDCNGNGTVGLSDTLAINLNFSQTHSFRLSGASSATGDDLYFSPSYTVSYNKGGWHVMNISLGSATNNISSIYGIVFDIAFNSQIVDNNQAYVSYPGSFLNAGNQNVPFRRVSPAGGLINCVSVRTDHNNVSGNGKIAELHFKHNNSTSGQGSLTFTLSNVRMIDKTGSETALSGSVGEIFMTSVGVNEASLENAVLIFPNPASSQLGFRSAHQGRVSFVVTDLTGRKLLSGSFEKEGTLDVSSLAEGHYLVEFEGQQVKTNKPLIITHQ